MISRTLSDQYQPLDKKHFKRAQVGASRHKTATNPRLEELLFQIHQHWQHSSTVVQGSMIVKAAHRLWTELPDFQGLPEPHWSIGWLDGFKKRYTIKTRTMHGEGASVPEEAEQEMQTIRNQVALYAAEDIYNMDETGLFWKATPDRSLATERIAGRKKDKARITIVTACNATGTDKLPLWIIGKSARPRPFGSNNRNLSLYPIIYRSNAKAWINTNICLEWFQSFANHTYRPGRTILLLWDNHSAHEAACKHLQAQQQATGQYNWIKSMFLPANSTSRFQPLDQGIIKNFKAGYKNSLLEYIVHKTMAGERIMIDLLQAVQWSSMAWNKVTMETISNCWRHSTIFGPVYGPMLQPKYYNHLAVLAQQLEQLKVIKHAMDIESFLNPIDETAEDPRDLDPVDFVIQENLYEEEDAEDVLLEVPQPVVTIAMGRNYVDKLKVLVPQLEGDCSDIGEALGKLELILLQSQLRNMKQSTLTSWLQGSLELMS